MEQNEGVLRTCHVHEELVGGPSAMAGEKSQGAADK